MSTDSAQPQPGFDQQVRETIDQLDGTDETAAAFIAERQAEKVQPPYLIPVPAECENCGAPLAWRMGVGRYVISHATGDDMCSRASVRLADADREVARRAYLEADEAYRRALNSSPAKASVCEREYAGRHYFSIDGSCQRCGVSSSPGGSS